MTTRNHLLVQGQDYEFVFSITEANGSLKDLTDYSVTSKIKKSYGSTSDIDFGASVMTPATDGAIKLVLTGEQTGLMGIGRYVYDVFLTDVSGNRSPILRGIVTIDGGVSVSSAATTTTTTTTTLPIGSEQILGGGTY